MAALLSFVLPGLGQVYAGAIARGVAWMVPTLATLVGLIWLSRAPSALLNADFLIGLVVLNAAFFLYHVAAMIDAHALARARAEWAGPAVGRSSGAALPVLIVLALLLHGLPSAAALWGNAALDRLFPSRPDVIPIVSFAPEPTDTPAPTPSGSPAVSPSGPPASGAPTPFPPLTTPWGERLNVLLVGSDAGPGRTGGRTDTMILLSIEIATGKAAMFGFPRNKDNVPLPEDASGRPVNDRIFTDPAERQFPPGMLSSIWQRAHDNPNEYYTPLAACPAGSSVTGDCLSVARAYRATAGAIQNLAGVPINGIISVNLNGFADLVNAVGGVWIDVPYPVVDDNYPREDGTKIKINIKPGCQKLDGTLALAFARSRHQADDYQRMARQQLVLQAVRRQLDPLALLPQLDNLVNIAANNMYTTFDHGQLELLARVAARVNADRMYRVTFGGTANYPAYLDGTQIKKIRRTVQNIFSQPEPSPTPKPSKAPSCPPAGG
jgi:LCP family protein required for cell wall assembly